MSSARAIIEAETPKSVFRQATRPFWIGGGLWMPTHNFSVPSGSRRGQLGLYTMGQLGADYPDIWLGRFLRHEIVKRTNAVMDIMADLPDDTTYDHLDGMLRLAVKL